MSKFSYNPDVLSCLANLSNDEVFTPPQLANQMLDMLPQELFSSPDTKFLDPCTKSGVFLREIAKRLIDGLADKIPDLQKRIDHIMHHQIYGIAITRLTSLMSRRSLYCSKDASGKYSLSHFDDADGNIHFDEILHTWQNGKCRYCGASQEVYDRGDDLETHAYEFIHTDNPNELYNNMTFDVIIGNPPYQLGDGGNNASATPIYNLFVTQARKLNPLHLIMIVPSRWYCGGRGLDEFRNMMLEDESLQYIYDYKKSADCFPGIRNGGGICYFLRNVHYKSALVNIANHVEGEKANWVQRKKLDFGLNFFIRDNKVYEIVKKVKKQKESSLSDIVYSQKPYGFRTNFTDFVDTGTIKLYTKKSKRGYEYVTEEQISKNKSDLRKWKLVTSRSTSVPEEDNGQVLRMSQTFIVEPMAVVTESYIVICVSDNKEIVENCYSYLKTRFFRLLCQITIVSPDVSQRTFTLVPLQDFSKPWTDEELYKKYGLTDEEIQFIESMIRPME
jgi:site-specific DNA-methyltransferase (adenine-specific)